MFYLYKKTHLTTGLQYLGYTKKNPYAYKGSGLYWRRHLKVHSNNVCTEVLHELTLIEEVRTKGLYYSQLWNIVSSPDWANLKQEDGNSQQWVDGRTVSTFRERQAKGARGNTNVRGRKWWLSVVTGKLRRSVQSPGFDWVQHFLERSEEIKTSVSKKLSGRPKTAEHKEKLSNAAKGRVSNNKGTVWVRNAAGVRRRVSPHTIPQGFKPVKDLQNDIK